jgi:hypothetical protein
MEEESFAQVFENLEGLSNKRDPRYIRLASVASALNDISGGNPTPAKYFASAIETLEGTLHQRHQEANDIFDSLSTQRALVDIIGLVISHVAPATLAATFSLTSRILRAVIHSCGSIGTTQQLDSIMLDTQDGLGGVNTLLCSSCKTISELLRHLPQATDDKTVASLVNSTLLSFFKDSSSKVQSSATTEICGLLAMDSPKCHSAILKESTKYMKKEVERSIRDHEDDDGTKGFIDLLGFLQHSIMYIDFTSIGGRLMELLISLFAESSSGPSSQPVFVTKLKDTRKRILTINAILATILSMLEHEIDASKEKQLCVFASRVLASLVQVRPTLAFRHGVVEDDLLESGRSIVGQVMLSACQRLLSSGELETGSKMLPLVVQHVANLSRPSENSLDNAVAETLMPELSQLFRMQLTDLKATNPVIHKQCSQASLGAMEIILSPSFQSTWAVSLKPMVILMQQIDDRDDKVMTCLESILKLRCQMSEDTTFHHSIDDAISFLIQEIGIEGFWGLIKLTNLCFSKGGKEHKYFPGGLASVS